MDIRRDSQLVSFSRSTTFITFSYRGLAGFLFKFLQSSTAKCNVAPSRVLTGDCLKYLPVSWFTPSKHFIPNLSCVLSNPCKETMIIKQLFSPCFQLRFKRSSLPKGQNRTSGYSSRYRGFSYFWLRWVNLDLKLDKTLLHLSENVPMAGIAWRLNFHQLIYTMYT